MCFCFASGRVRRTFLRQGLMDGKGITTQIVDVCWMLEIPLLLLELIAHIVSENAVSNDMTPYRMLVVRTILVSSFHFFYYSFDFFHFSDSTT